MSTGVYKIINTISKKVYVGSSSNLNVRKSQHFNKLRKNIHINKKLQNSWNKYGEGNFIFEIILLCEKNDLISNEQKYIDLLNAVKNGYNLAPIAGRSTLGFKHSEESKRKMSIAKTGVKLPRTEEHQAKLTATQIGRTVHQETRNKISRALKGTKPSEETREKLRQACKTKTYSPKSETAKTNMAIAQRKRFARERHQKSLMEKI